ncbi:GDP-Man:Man(3)GlcNAc(2)-PP-Dol alpha-1,2-mannosyltransferase [Galendromus occidentalis]|uniref:GDP-Man:Man(3)GlcNAc(2)-PP-Dol alpha-1,2-mannosyltransferase n=1 Tax=Galendromus occidentalis TaxID=34638 RepID=A0AAJ6VY17_9ACAR|nr:GDP-Man:Man(3)GlcNAc(2)-PP-Dol alpha-1,2-mannosyltransferase [Galendromus occidentalis]
MIATILTVILAVVNSIALLAMCLRSRKSRGPRTYGFFHPYCNAGGGGERVLWTAVRCLQRRYPNIKCVIYTGDLEASSDEILATAERRFHIKLSQPVSFVYLRSRPCLEAKYYKVFTLALQSAFSMLVGLEAIIKHTPHVFVDTMGYAFTLPIFKILGGCTTVSYVHYPTISTDMLCSVHSRRTGVNNSSMVASSSFLTQAKILYYKCFAVLYGFIGNVCGDVTMVNSSWTYGHIREIWGVECHLVFPPCSVEDFQQLESEANPEREFRIVSLAQFRPEKDHMLQLKSLKILQKHLSEAQFGKVKLVLCGSCRDHEDEQRIEDLKIQANCLEITKNVEFKVDIPYSALKKELQKASAAIHTMWNEHFGIAVVECIAAGLITVAHNSGGPRMDIIREGCGFRASTAEEYAQIFAKIIMMSERDRTTISEAGKRSMSRFNERSFEEKFLEIVQSWVEENR